MRPSVNDDEYNNYLLKKIVMRIVKRFIIKIKYKLAKNQQSETHPGGILAGYGDPLKMRYEIIFFDLEAMIDVIRNSWME